MEEGLVLSDFGGWA